MSVEIPTMVMPSVDIAGAVPFLPSIAPSINVGGLDSGGAFVAGLNSASIFSETAPFSASAASVPELPLGNFSDVFSSAYVTLGKTDTSIMPTTDSLQKLGFEPFRANSLTSPEKTIDLTQGEWTTVAKAPKKTAEQSLRLATPDTQGEDAVIREALEVDKAQSKKLVELLVSAGVYEEERAKERVSEITQNSSVQVEPEVQPMTKIVVQGTQPETSEAVLGIFGQKEHAGGDFEKKLLSEAPVVDESAQNNRKQMVKDRIFYLFQKARRVGAKTVNSREITGGLEENSKNRSYLLEQLKLPKLPDGSLDEAVKAVVVLGDSQDVTRRDELIMLKRVDQILEKNVPVKISIADSKTVTETDVDRVLKFAKQKKALV